MAYGTPRIQFSMDTYWICVSEPVTVGAEINIFPRILVSILFWLVQGHVCERITGLSVCLSVGSGYV
jgi:hypothetical protein